MTFIANRAMALVLLSGLSLLSQQCSPTCDVEILAETVAPDRTHVATVFVENCHATAPFVTAVNVRCGTCELDTDSYVFATEGRQPLTIVWEKPASLEIRHKNGLKVYRRESGRDGVAITYAVDETAAGHVPAPVAP